MNSKYSGRTADRPVGRLQRFSTKHPVCCFCGGTAPTTSIDHIPSRQAFALKRRPKGLEFPACGTCNSSTSKDEQVVALLTRIYPDARTVAERDEIRAIMNAVGNNHPGLLPELLPAPDVAAQYPGHRILHFGGPRVRACLERFSVKLLLALHYEFTGTVVPITGGIRVAWFSNLDAIEGRLPSALLSAVGPPLTLKQGMFEVADQFWYSGRVLEEGAVGAYFAAFRKAFAIGGMVCMDSKYFEHDGEPTYGPLRHIA